MRSLETVRRPVRGLRAAVIAAGLLCLASVSGLAQERRETPRSVYVRELHIDPIVVSFGLDTVRLRSVVVDLIKKAGHFRADSGAAVPALDLALTVPRAIGAGELEPRALLRIEVGRNLMETGNAKFLVWERTLTLPAYPTWRALVAAAEGQILEALSAYPAPPRSGA